MDYLIFSDTHGGAQAMLRVIERCAGTFDGVLFLGDGLADLDRVRAVYPDLAITAVAGNCDFSAKYLAAEWREKLITPDGVRVLMMHGHHHGVKYGTSDAAAYARAKGADVLLFGHTHEPMARTVDGLHIFNPGSAFSPREGEPTFGRLTIRNGQVLLSHGTVYGG